MKRHVLLNNADHADLRIITTRSAAYGDDVMSAVTFPGEFRNVQAHYPIFFQKHPETGRFHPVALFGFRHRENLFLTDEGWDAAYVPMTIERQPFLIGRDGADESRLVVHVDLESPRISRTEGERVFLEHGGLSDYLGRVNSLLDAIHHGLESNGPFVDALLEHGLLESFTLDVELDDGAEFRLAGYYTIHEEKLDALGADALASLNTRGYLKAVYLAVASLSRVRDLIERKNGQPSGIRAS